MNPRILVIDDSPTQRQYLGDVLAAGGYAVLTAQDGSQGVAIARSGRPDLIVMDVVMPGYNGFQASCELARDPDTAAIPVVMGSTKAQGVDRLWALRQGAREYLVKPVDPDELLACVAGLVG